MTDRQLITWSCGAALALILGTVLFSPPAPQGRAPFPSTYSSGENGARAAFLLLQELGYPVQRWEEPPSALAQGSKHSVLILAEPIQTPTDGERRQLREWVAEGGHLLFCGPQLNLFFPEAAVEASQTAKLVLTPAVPSQWTQGAREIELESSAEWRKLRGSQIALYTEENAAAIVAWRIGHGEVLWWAAGTPLTNDHIAQRDNLRLFLNSIRSRDGSSRPQVFWDEYFHGERSSWWSYLEKSGLRSAALQAGVALCLVLFTFSRRWGPLVQPYSRSRLSPLEFVETLGGLYQRAGATAVPVQVSYRQLRLSVARQLALPGDSKDGQLVEAAAQRLGWDRVSLSSVMERARKSESEKVRPSEALAIVKELEDYQQRLRANQPGPVEERK